MRTKDLPVLLGTLRAIGFASIVRVLAYKFGLRSGLHPVLRISAEHISGAVFDPPDGLATDGLVARQEWSDATNLFGWLALACDAPPDWKRNVFNGKQSRVDNWHQLPDFDADLGDVKGVWEASRFDWMLAFAQRAALGDRAAFDRLRLWLEDWMEAAPPYSGANWKCGQEASIRVLHLLAAAIMLQQDDTPAAGLIRLVEIHLHRIAPTMSYAIGQDNNHGTSEAAALFCGGSLLAAAGVPRGRGWELKGRKWLEDRARRLIAEDGSFSQHSLVYHRMMLDTLSFAETWRRRRGLPDFSDAFLERAQRATSWLRQFVDLTSGDGPNYGANDGAHILALSGCEYRDFRPSLQWSVALFFGRRAVAEDGLWNQQLRWLGLDVPKQPFNEPQSKSFDCGGTHVLRNVRAVAYLNYPRFRFRPSQADALHCDLWVGGENILRDGGSYSYNSSSQDIAYFSGTASHNTVQFDGRDQMVRLGRFLFGSWLNAEQVEEVHCADGAVKAGAAYRDRWGAFHRRTVALYSDRLVCEDTIDGKADSAVLRWRCKPGDWRLDGNVLRNDEMTITISSDDSTMAVRLAGGEESRYYGLRAPLPVLEITLGCPARVVSTIEFA